VLHASYFTPSGPDRYVLTQPRPSAAPRNAVTSRSTTSTGAIETRRTRHGIGEQVAKAVTSLATCGPYRDYQWHLSHGQHS